MPRGGNTNYGIKRIRKNPPNKKMTENHKIKFKTKDGTIKEQKFDDFNEFADVIQDAALDYYKSASAAPEMEISSAFGAYGIQHKESFKNGERHRSEVEFLGEEVEGM